METLTTATEVRRALGENYNYLVSKYDIKQRERRATQCAKRELKPSTCAACGDPASAKYRLEAAHIAALSEGATTFPDNLLWLCRERSRDCESGCHTLFDQGGCSIAEMRECRQLWASGYPSNLRTRMLEFRSRYGPGSQQQGHLRNELGALCKQQGYVEGGSEKWHYLQLRKAELIRRRSKKGALIRANEEIEKVHPEKFSGHLEQSQYFYERGYIALLTGRLDDAFSYFESGRSILGDNVNVAGSRWRWAAHTALLSQISSVMRSADESKGWSWYQIREELSQALIESETDARTIANSEQIEVHNEYRHARRWVHNSLVHLIKPDIAEGNLESAYKRWQRAYENWQSMDISSGWDAGFRVTHLSLYGQLRRALGGNVEELDEALAYLVRSLVLQIGGRHRQPEGIRDLLFCIANALQKRSDQTYQEIRSIASHCMDFSSWFNPFVPRVGAPG